MKTLPAIICAFLFFTSAMGQSWQSAIVPIVNGKLTYVSDENQGIQHKLIVK